VFFSIRESSRLSEKSLLPDFEAHFDRLGEQNTMDNNDIAAMKFEDALAALEQSAQRLERGDLSLEDSILTYERSVALANHCDRLLEQAELRVRRLIETDDGTLQEVAFP